ncbi:MAG: Rieske 2Fe-2S domain-containing protein [Streptosporangiales bacterium]|nr:Rieske 2Fe-2S domain-containing protein [Streptosporangiales bacterium]
MSWERAARSEDVGRVLHRVDVGGHPMLVARTADGDAIAVGPICPHQNKPMDGGNVYGDEVDCPNHHYTYDARTGENGYPKRVFPARRAAAVKPITAYRTREADGWVWVHTGSSG